MRIVALILLTCSIGCSDPNTSSIPATDGGTLGLGTEGSTAAQRPPNILFVIADDFGVDVSPCYSDAVAHMPHLLALCADGLVFETAWSNPICSPTRATLLTGRYSARTTVGSQVEGNQTPGLPLDEVTLAQLLKNHPDHPYATGAFGKWHLSNQDNGGAQHPQTAGFDHFSGLLQGGVQDYERWQRTVDGETETVEGYTTTITVDDAMAWLDKLEDQPWFVWLAFTAPHSPWHRPPEGLYYQEGLTGEANHIQNNRDAYYAAAAEALDMEMGRLLDHRRVKDEPTMIVFLGDNGTPNQVLPASRPRGRGKSSLFEGGIHVPLVIAGAGLATGARIPHPVNAVDLFSTALDWAGIPAPSDRSIDGLSLIRYGTDPLAPPTRSWIYSELFGSNVVQSRTGQTLRDDRFKWIGYQDGSEMFFDLHDDPNEQLNLFDAVLSADAQASQADFEQALQSLGGRR
ncbi:MAG: hypothetical protein CMH50_09660 [Myxococcales bacterium]|nr:hypothetical protein [Myxococcales bacterium]